MYFFITQQKVRQTHVLLQIYIAHKHPAKLQSQGVQCTETYNSQVICSQQYIWRGDGIDVLTRLM